MKLSLFRFTPPLAVALALHVFVYGQSAPTSPLLLITPEGRRPLPTVMIGGQEMVALDDLAAIFDLTVREDTLAGAVTVTYGSSSILLTPDQTLASVAGRLVSLPAPLSRGQDRRWIVPVEFINRALGPVYASPLDLRKASRLVIAGNLRVPRVVARYDTSGGGTRAVFDISPRTAATVVQDRDRLLVRFDADWLDASLPAPPPQGFVSAARVAEPGNVIAIDPGPRFGSFRATTSSGDASSARLTVDLLPPESETTAAGPTPAPAPPTETAPFAPGGLPGLRTIVIDAGHGGDEHGARGSSGTLEKDVTLAVARRLKGMIESRLGIRVLMTRDDDRTVGLDERASIANNNKADLFLSLHANSSARRSLKGAEVFYLSLDKYGDEARRLAEAERQALPVFGGGERDIDLILWDMAQARHIEQSATLAGLVEEHLRGRVDMGPRALQQAPFRVLVGANMPAVLVEMGFISNPEQERQLASTQFQTALTQGLFDAIVRFRAYLEGPRGRAVPSPASDGQASDQGRP